VKLSAKTRLFAAWFVLVAITLSYLWIDHAANARDMLLASTAVTMAAIGFALVKVRIILREFMDVRHAPPLLRRFTDLLVAIMAVALLGTYIVGKAVAS